MIGSILGGIIGNATSGSERRSARDRMSEALGAFSSIRVPTIEEQRIQLEMLKEAGVLTPEMEQYMEMQISQMEQLKEDPALREAQTTALELIRQKAQGGLSAEERANFNQIRQQLRAEQQAKQQQILNQMAARGMGGSGAEMAALLLGSQAGADRASAEGDRIAAAAEQARAAALQQMGSLSGQVRGQDFDVNRARAQAADALQQFNIQNRIGTQQRNISARNQAQAANLANKQRVMDTNVGLRNQQEIHNKALYQQLFDNEMKKAAGLSGQLNMMAAGDRAEAARQAQMWQGIGSGVDDIGQSVAQAIMGVPPVKTPKSSGSGGT